jgi:hypothetical protein
MYVLCDLRNTVLIWDTWDRGCQSTVEKFGESVRFRDSSSGGEICFFKISIFDDSAYLIIPFWGILYHVRTIFYYPGKFVTSLDGWMYVPLVIGS